MSDVVFRWKDFDHLRLHQMSTMVSVGRVAHDATDADSDVAFEAHGITRGRRLGNANFGSFDVETQDEYEDFGVSSLGDARRPSEAQDAHETTAVAEDSRRLRPLVPADSGVSVAGQRFVQTLACTATLREAEVRHLEPRQRVHVGCVGVVQLHAGTRAGTTLALHHEAAAQQQRKAAHPVCKVQTLTPQ